MWNFSDLPSYSTKEKKRLGWLRYSRNALMKQLQDEVGEEGIKELRRFHNLKNKKSAIKATSKKLMEASPKFLEKYNHRLKSDYYTHDKKSNVDFAQLLIYEYEDKLQEMIKFENEIIEIICKDE